MKQDTKENWEARVQKVLNTIKDSLDESILAKEFAHDASSSRWHFERAFRTLTGESFSSCVRRLRLERAAYTLKEGIPVLTAALNAGYESSESFCRAFKKAFGLNPSRVSSLPWWKGELPSPNGLHWRPGTISNWHSAQQTKEHTGTRIISLPPMEVLSLEGVKDFWQLPQLWQQLENILLQTGIKPEPTSFMSIFEDQKGSPVASPALIINHNNSPIPGTILKKIPGGLYAITTFTGPTEAIGPYWESLRGSFFYTSLWTKDKARPSLEWYQNVPPDGLSELTVTFLCDPVSTARRIVGNPAE